MAQQFINRGAAANDKSGTPARDGARIINENFAELYSEIAVINRIDTIEKSMGFSEITAQDITIYAGWEWIINNVSCTNPADVLINDIPFCAAGKTRIDYIVPNETNGFTLISGEESTTGPLAPSLPNNGIYATYFTVGDASISVPSQPITGDNYISKREKAAFQVYQSGEINNTVLDDFFYGYLNFRDAVTNLKSIGTYTNGHLYSGRELLIKNSQATDITIYHLTGSGFQFSFPNEVNFILKPNEIIRFSTKILSPTSGILEYVGVVLTKADIGLGNVDNTSDADKPVSTAQQEALDLKLNTADYNQHYKGTFLTEAALNAAHPTASVGDYAQVNEAGGTDVVNYSWDAEENIWVAGGGTGGAANTDALPEGSTNLYWTVARFLANLTYANVIAALGFTPSTAPNNAQKNSDITKAEIEAKLTGEITSHTHPVTVLPVTETGTSFSLTDAHNGKITILTASCTVTIPNDLMAGFEHTIVTLAGVTLTIALGGSVTLFNNSGTTMAEKLSCTIKNRAVTNQYITAGNL